jgi:hypothetical protein
MVSTVDKYISHIAEEWMKENELAVEQGIKTGLAENFMSGLKRLFEESYIDIPEEKVDAVEALASEVERLKISLDEAVETGIALKEQLKEKEKESIIKEMAEDLSLIEQDKFFSLVEDVTFTSENSFRDKLNTIKESYFKKKKKVRVTEESEDDLLGMNVDETTDGEKTFSKMDRYAQALAPKIDPRYLVR